VVELSVRELDATAEAIGSRRHSLHDFSSIFRDVASARDGGWSMDIPRSHLQENVSRADEQFAERIADTSAVRSSRATSAVTAAKRTGGTGTHPARRVFATAQS